MSFTIRQDLFVDDTTAITVVKCNDDTVTVQHLQPLLDAPSRLLGISATYGKQCQLSSIAFSTPSHVLVVSIPAHHIPKPKDKVKKRRVMQCRSLIRDLLSNPEFQKYAFKADQLAVALHLDISIRINNAVDMLSVSTSDRQSLEALMNAMGGETMLRKKNVQALFFPDSRSPTVDPAVSTALQAWAACHAATLPHMLPRFATIRKIDTGTFLTAHLDAIANISRHADRLDALKPTVTKNDTQESFTGHKGAINLVCDRFSSRLKQSTNQSIQIELENKGSTSRVSGRVHRVDGRKANININGPVKGRKILSVMTIGRDDPTSAELARQDIILKTLQRNTNILSNPFFRALWLPKERPVWPAPTRQNKDLSVHSSLELNPSQQAGVQRILSNEDDDRITIIQGPPGTGKTTVIAASVISHHHARSSQGIWIAAQSNVAVKNIAEKFIKEDFGDFRILVSKDFHYDWHEHLYEKLGPCLIRSDNFAKSVVSAERQVGGSKVILCTLSMFSNPNVGVYLRTVPVEIMILDEASQIECGNYLPVFSFFHSTLSKLVFIGDDKQLPPYGQEDVPQLRSVFECSHLRKGALFLDTQYRMPSVIGNFISRNIYGGKLRTQHRPTTFKPCRFIDVDRGREAKMGHSWINMEEARIVVKLVRLYTSKAMSFRIVTPYDAQRSFIERHLKREGLPWEDKVFNVDSFQGNEDEHIIVSVVRSKRPGFLNNQRRTNVMLTRCKQSMVICSSRAFLLGSASETLVGKLAVSLRNNNCWVDGHGFLCDRVDLFA